MGPTTHRLHFRMLPVILCSTGRTTLTTGMLFAKRVFLGLLLGELEPPKLSKFLLWEMAIYQWYFSNSYEN